jgi:hypothetical protein
LLRPLQGCFFLFSLLLSPVLRLVGALLCLGGVLLCLVGQ